MIGVCVGVRTRLRAVTCRPSKSTSPSCSNARNTVRYSRRLVSGASQRTPYVGAIISSCPGPMPSRKRPGASDSSATTSCAKVIGWRGHVCTIDVPSRMRSVCVSAAANVVIASAPPATPIVAHAACTPAFSACRTCATASAALPAWIETPMIGCDIVRSFCRVQYAPRAPAAAAAGNRGAPIERLVPIAGRCAPLPLPPRRARSGGPLTDTHAAPPSSSIGGARCSPRRRAGEP